MSRSRWASTLRALTPPVLGSTALALVGLAIARSALPSEALRTSNDAVGSYLQTLGSIYAVLLAFVVYVVWGQFNQARDFAEAEASNWIDLLQTTPKLGPPGVEIRARAVEYIDAVLAREWPALASARAEDAVVDAVGAILDRVGEALHACRPADGLEMAWFAEALSRFNDVSDSRTNRLANSRQRIPLALRLLLQMGAASTVGSLYLLHVESAWVHAVMTASLAGAVSHVLFVIRDLDNCYSGHWQAPRAPFERVARWLAHHGVGAAR